MAIVLILLYGVDIFWLSGFCVYYFGEWGIPMYEGLLAVLALGIVVLFREDVKRAFPFHRPTIAKTVGTLLMWIGTLLITMIPTSILLYVFPEQMSGATESVSELSGGLPFGLAFLLICVTPAIFEEIAFRGGLFSCFRGFRSPWPAILISAAVFGAFHGSFWRFVPTAMLGIAMGYLLAETDNMFYNMFFHLINNALSDIAFTAYFQCGFRADGKCRSYGIDRHFACDGGGVFYLCFGRTVSDLCGELPDP